ncbi:DUF1350 family protein [Leptolyngbya sp. FACHB-261]|uniref:DUF1350 family protein n=1 Tax=Leptolyngbya sp. FACHB-261 TaxID=2692806 RepID=UPI001681C91C|nr:DUF1350 family protein [Leptolyngbya sp. FACHB-261]MBD2099345.1 DUF1350 family protein [Leptolyngbya sp. FACHB-261]
MQAKFRFRPVSFSWVAVHPEPKGVIQFVGGAFFGTFPTIFYRYFLRKLFEEGYTIVTLPFRFSFRHWPLAIGLLREQDALRQELTTLAIHLGYEHEIYNHKDRYLWIGHSLGCKYITLLEFLSGKQWPQAIEACIGRKERQRLENLVEANGPEELSIKGQPSLLIAPDISNTESAIPVRAVAQLLDRLQLGVLPTREQTQCLISGSDLFNLAALVSFKKDELAGSITDGQKSEEIQKNSDVLWLLRQLQLRRLPAINQELPGKHLEPLGIQIGPYVVDFNPLDKFVELLSQRFLEKVVIQFLDKLKQRAKDI